MDLNRYEERLEQALIKKSKGDIIPWVAKGVANLYTSKLKDATQGTINSILHKDVHTIAEYILTILSKDCFYSMNDKGNLDNIPVAIKPIERLIIQQEVECSTFKGELEDIEQTGGDD